jgi:hypothetical protein
MAPPPTIPRSGPPPTVVFPFLPLRLIPHPLLSLPGLRELAGAAAVHWGARAASGHHRLHIEPPPRVSPHPESLPGGCASSRCCSLRNHIVPRWPGRRRWPRHRARPERGDRAMGVLGAPASRFQPWTGPRWRTTVPSTVAAGRMLAHRREILFFLFKNLENI